MNHSGTTFSAAIRIAAVALLALFLHGCGEIEWFPGYVRLPTTPDLFSFEAQTGKDVGESVTSAPITVSGLTADSSPISITGSLESDSKYSIGSGTATSAAGTVKNGDIVTVTHKASSVLGTPTTSTLTIGTVSANFVSTTKSVDTPSFTGLVEVGTYKRTYAIITSFDGAPGTHVVSIEDAPVTGNAQFSVTDNVDEPGNFSSVTQTITFLNGKRLWVRNLVVNVDAGVKTTVTIDGIRYEVPLAVAQ